MVGLGRYIQNLFRENIDYFTDACKSHLSKLAG